MTEFLEQILEKVGVTIIREESAKTGTPQEAMALVLRMQKGKLGVFLFNGPKFIRRVEMSELAELLS